MSGGPALATCRDSTLATLLLLAAAAWLVAACGGPPWQEVSIPDAGFRIEMRGDAQVEKRDLDTPIGKITGHWYSTEKRDAVFGVGYADYPLQLTRNAPPRQLFAIVREGWVKRIEGKLQGDSADIWLDGHPGMEFVASGKFNGRDVYLRGRFYLVDNRLYQVVVFGDKETLPRSDINHFMASFKLVERRPVTTMNIDAGVQDKPPPRERKKPPPAEKK